MEGLEEANELLAQGSDRYGPRFQILQSWREEETLGFLLVETIRPSFPTSEDSPLASQPAEALPDAQAIPAMHGDTRPQSTCE